MTKDEIQLWMLIAFLFALVLGFYKVYAIFNAPAPGLDINVQHSQLQEIIKEYLKHVDDSELSHSELFSLLKELDTLNDDIYKNFNLNRLNQLLQQLFYIYKVSSLSELIISIQHEA